MRRSPALSLLPVLLCALLCTGCQSTPEDAVPYSEEAIYAFLEDAVLSGEPSVTGYFTGNGTAPSPQDAVHTVAQALSDGTFCIALRPESGRWSEADVEQLALSAIDNAALPCTVSTSYLLCPAEHSDRQFVALLYEPKLEEAEYTSC